MPRVRVVAAVLLGFALSLRAQSVEHQSRPSKPQLDVLVEQFRKQHNIPALSVAVADNSELVYSGAAGIADLENNHPATIETVFRIASVTKPLTATLVLRLHEQRRFDLDAPIQIYCPAYPAKQWKVTARDLLSHVAGVPDYQRVERGVWWFRTPAGSVEGSSTHHFASVNEALAVIAEDPLGFEPGTRFGYTNGGFVLLGCAIEGVTGLDFATAMREHLLGPAGMTRTLPDDAYAVIQNRARPYQMRSENNKDFWWWTRAQKKLLQIGRLYNARAEDTSLKLPAGGYMSTATDLIRFANALNSGRLLRSETRAAMLTERMAGDKGTGWGLGISVGSARGRVTAGLTGGQAGASAHLRMVPEKGFAIAIIANRDLAPIGDLINQIGSLYGYFDAPAAK